MDLEWHALTQYLMMKNITLHYIILKPARSGLTSWTLMMMKNTCRQIHIIGHMILRLKTITAIKKGYLQEQIQGIP